MSKIPKTKTSRLRLALLIVFVIGLLVTIYPVFRHPSECPTGYSQAQIDASNCIIGADIGSGLMLVLGVLIGFIALYGMALTFVWSKFHFIKNKWLRVIAFIFAAIFPIILLSFFVP